MNAEEFTRINQQLTNPKTGRFDHARIKALDDDTKRRYVTYLIGLKRPIIVDFIRLEQKDELVQAGYEGGYFNDFYAYWLLPHHRSHFQSHLQPEQDPPGGSPTDPTPLPDQVPATDSNAPPTKPRRRKTRTITDKRAAVGELSYLERIADQLYQLRTGQRLTLSELAKLSGVSLEQISRYESGKYGINLASADKLFRAMGEEIMGFNTQPISPSPKKK